MSLRARIFKDELLYILVILFSLSTLLPLFFILFTITINGVSVINFDFLIKLPKPAGEAGGGILNALLGTFLLIAIAFLVAAPFGILVGIFLVEVRNKFTKVLKVLVNVLQGVPSIVMGIIGYLLVVKPSGGFSALSGGVSLGLMMLPVVINNTEETLRRVPFYLREASYSLGVSYTRTVLKVVLPAGISGVLSGILIGILRISGETAPLLLTAFGNPFLNINPIKPVDALPLIIFNYTMSPYQDWHRIAWGASFVLVVLVLILNISTKLIAERK